MFTDTVGFIHKLPHHLIEAFRSTLEEAKYADLILHVVDGSNENYEHHMQVVYETLKELKVADKPIVTVFNKSDLFSSNVIHKDLMCTESLCISAKKNQKIDEMLQVINQVLTEDFLDIEKLFSYEEANKIQLIRKYGHLLKEEYKEDGIFVKASVPGSIAGKVL